MNDRNIQFKSGFVALIGPPNSGKSTLLNTLLGEKISITSRKPQTTRNRILGVVHRPDSQIIFIDTPGIHKASSPLNIMMVEEAISTIGDVDLVLLMLDATNQSKNSEEILTKNLEKSNKPCILALNKIDLVKKPALLELIDKWSRSYPFKAVIPVSAKHGTQTEELAVLIESCLNPGPQYFPEDTLTDAPERYLAGEMIREKVFRLTGQEIPYSSAVTIDSFSHEKNNDLVKIHATIHLERDSQKGIIIGKKGSKLKQVGEQARKDMERMLGSKVFLKLFVRVQKNWSRDTKAMRKLGY